MGQIQNIILISLFCCGWYGVTQPNMILFRLGQLRDRLPAWAAKPLGSCVPCSASGIGSVAYLLVMHGNYSLITWIVYIMAAAYMNSLLWFTYTAVYERTQELRSLQGLRFSQHQAILKQQHGGQANIVNDCKVCGDGKAGKNIELEEQRQK